MNFRLTTRQRYRLRRTRDTTHDADVLRRSLALLLLDQGASVATIAIELGVSRQSIYNWLDRYLLAPTPRAVRDRRGHGHHTAWDDDRLAVLRSAVERPPGDWGYRELEWTVDLLRQHLARWDGRSWSGRAVRRQLHRSGYVWKRPRYVLDPDPEREKKTADPPGYPEVAAPVGQALRG
jgi:transposase